MRKDHKTGQDKPNTALNACPRWTKANYFMKKRIIEEIQEVTSLCKICSNLGHLSGSCYFKEKAVCENNECGQEHVKEICEFQPFITGCLQHTTKAPFVGGCMRLINVNVAKEDKKPTVKKFFTKTKIPWRRKMKSSSTTKSTKSSSWDFTIEKVKEASDNYNNSAVSGPTVSEETFKEQIGVRGSVSDLLSTSTTSSISLDRMSAIFQEGATDSVNESNEESDKGEIKSTEINVPDSKVNDEMPKL